MKLRSLRADLEQVAANSVTRARQKPDAPDRAIGRDRQRRVGRRSVEQRAAGPVVAREVRHRGAGPRALPRHRLPHGLHPLLLILAHRVLPFVVRNLEAGAADARHHLQHARWSDLPSELDGAGERMPGVVEVVRVRRIEEPRRALPCDVEGEVRSAEQGTGRKHGALARRFGCDGCFRDAAPPRRRRRR